MCLAAVYVKGDEDAAKELALDKVQCIDVEGERLVCRNLFRQVVTIRGAIRQVDLENSTVTVIGTVCADDEP